MEASGKVVIALSIIKFAMAHGERVLLFSQSLSILDMFEAQLATPTWRRLEVFRLDGSTPAAVRANHVKTFNGPGTRPRVYLISTKAGCVGINLVSATRAILFDVSWNPAHDLQATFRLYRFGQTKRVFIYRLVSYGTMEAKIFGRQMLKQSLALRVVDDAAVERFFAARDLADLYALDEGGEITEPDIESGLVSNDQALASLIAGDAAPFVVGAEDIWGLLGQGSERHLTRTEKTAILAEWDVLQVLAQEQRKRVQEAERAQHRSRALAAAKAGVKSGLVSVTYNK